MLVRRFILVSAAALVVGLFALAGVVRAEDELWQTDFAAAKTKAKAENKLMFVDFTGSDWCGWCKKLVAEVFSKDAFKTEAPKKFVLVELDYPRDKKQSDELKKQNRELAAKYKIQGYPTILVMDAEGKVVAKTGYRQGGPEEYVKHLAAFIDAYGDVVKMMKEVEKLQGVDRAKLLDKIAEVYTNKLDNGDSDEVLTMSKEIVALDPDNKSGLKPKHQFNLVTAEFEGLREKMKFVEAVARLKKGVEEIKEGPQVSKLKQSIKDLQPMADAQETIAKLKPELATAKGVDRAKILDKLVDACDKLGFAVRASRVMPQDVDKWSKEIVKLDPDNAAGLKKKHEFRVQVSEATTLMQSGKFADARTALGKALALHDLSGEQIQTGHFLKALSYLNERNAKDGVEELQKALDAAPDTPRGQMIKRALPQLKKQVEAEKPKK
ncbi:MAG: thioredoxin fold domain-containing protein [Thermoguttaceae bacterium]|jgi:thioredoxin-related protein